MDDVNPTIAAEKLLPCFVCFRELPVGLAVVLRTCKHSFCIPCLKNAMFDGTADRIECPYPCGQFECKTGLEDDEVAFLLEHNEIQDVPEDSAEAVVSIGDKAQNEPKSDESTAAIAEPPSAPEDLEQSLSEFYVKEEKQITPEDLDYLLALSDLNLSYNLEPFECPICNESFQPYEGVMLSLCFHNFCKQCLTQTVRHTEDIEIKCLAVLEGTANCTATLQDHEIRALLSTEEYGKYQERCVQRAEAVIPNTVHCLQPNCSGWIEAAGNVRFFDCPVCSTENCTACKALHAGKTCQDYQGSLKRKEDEILSDQALRTLETKREGMRCPTCGIMITKIAGCNHMKCTMCKKDFNWAPKGPQ